MPLTTLLRPEEETRHHYYRPAAARHVLGWGWRPESRRWRAGGHWFRVL